MKETRFIEQNLKKWKEFESLHQSNHKDSNLYSKLFIQITDDLSYSRTFYGNRSVRVYLNNLAQDIFQRVFSRNRKKQNAFKDYITEELPSILFYHRKELLIAFIILVVSILIGLFTYKHDGSFARKMLGDGYLEMTARNIAKKDPMAVYKDMNQVEMFVMIVLNNLKVDLFTFFSGIFMGIGSILVLFQNGMMLAAFQYYFVKRGLFWDSFLAVWLHGTLEISAMVICGAAGIVLGKGLLFPGTYSRMQSFLSSAQRASKIFFAVLPITFVAGIIESFLTRYTQMPDALRLGLILASLFFILGYFVYYPWLKYKNGTLRIPEAEKVLPENYLPFEFFSIKKLSEILLDTFRLFRKYASGYLQVFAYLLVISFIIGWSIGKHYLLDNMYFNGANVYNSLLFIKVNWHSWFSIIPLLMLFSYSTYTAYIFYKEFAEQQEERAMAFFQWMRFTWQQTLSNLLIQVVFLGIYSYIGFKWYILLFVLPVHFIATYALYYPYYYQTTFFKRYFQTIKSEILSYIVLLLIFMFITFMIFTLVNSELYMMLYEAIALNLKETSVNANMLYLTFFIFSNMVLFSFILILFNLYQAVFYFSQKEKNTAEGLLNQLEKIGTKRRIYGF